MIGMRSFLLLAAGLVLIPSCSGAPGGEEESSGEASQAARRCEPNCGPNGKEPLLFWRPNVQAAYQALGMTALSQFPYLDTIPKKERREVFENAIGCALSQSQSVVDPYDGEVYTGWWGIAPTWVNAPLTLDQRAWVTGCMAQRLNAYHIHVEILLEGNTPALYPNAGLEETWSFQESKVWGDLFSPSVGPFELYACWEKGVEEVCGEPYEYLNKRICDEDNANCNLHIMGPCSEVCFTGTTGYPFCQLPNGTYDGHPVQAQIEPMKECDSL